MLGIGRVDRARFDQRHRDRSPVALELHAQRVDPPFDRVLRCRVDALERNGPLRQHAPEVDERTAAVTQQRVDATRCVIEFAEPQWAVTPGQSVVVYESQVCLGGGIIESGERVSTDYRAAKGACPPYTIQSG